MGLLTPCFVPGEGFLYTIIVPGGGFLLPSSRVPGGGGWFWMKLIPALLLRARCTCLIRHVVPFRSVLVFNFNSIFYLISPEVPMFTWDVQLEPGNIVVSS